MDELRKILIILSLGGTTHTQRLCVLTTVVVGENTAPSPAGNAFSAPLHPHTDLITHTSFPSLEAFTEKAANGEVGKCSFLPGPTCTRQSKWPQGLVSGGPIGECGPRKKAEVSDRIWLRLLASQWSPSNQFHPLTRRTR